MYGKYSSQFANTRKRANLERIEASPLLDHVKSYPSKEDPLGLINWWSPSKKDKHWCFFHGNCKISVKSPLAPRTIPTISNTTQLTPHPKKEHIYRCSGYEKSKQSHWTLYLCSWIMRHINQSFTMGHRLNEPRQLPLRWSLIDTYTLIILANNIVEHKNRRQGPVSCGPCGTRHACFPSLPECFYLFIYFWLLPGNVPQLC